MLETLTHYIMGVAGFLLILQGLELFLKPMPLRGLRFVLREVSHHFRTDVRSIQNQDHLEAAAFTVCFLKEHGSPSDRSLAYEFGLQKKEVAQMVRKAKWLIDSDEELKAFYAELDAKFTRARWWELL